MKSSIIDIFNDFLTNEESPKGPLYDTVPVIDSYKTVHRDDLEPVSIISPDLKNGPWIAGGAPLRWYQGKPVGESDIDIFCRDSLQADEVLTRIKDYGRWTEKFNSENAVTVGYWSKEAFATQWTLQIIKRRYFKSIEDVIRSFDLTVCEIGTCGNEWELGPFTARDIRKKNLRFKLPLQPDSVKRLTKYWIYGYRPVNGTIDSIVNDPNSKWAYNSEEDYNNAF